MRVLCIGDVVGSPGRRAVASLLPGLVAERAIDLVVANGENAAGGNGLTHETARDLFAAGVHVLTGGNHTWRFKEVVQLLERDARVLRPANFPEGAPGAGFAVRTAASGAKVGVINLQGRIYMDPLPSPFVVVDELIERVQAETKVILIDFHAEATSEKRALGWHVDGRASALFGTHTHVPTADEEILPGGTAYITDLGMTGPYDSVIGMKKELVLKRFRTMRPTSFAVAKRDVRLCGAIFEIDEQTGHARSVERLRLPLE